MRLASSVVGVLMLTGFVIPGESSAQSVEGRTARTVVTFDNVGDVPGVPEGITTDGKDGLYVSLFVLDQIWHVNPATGEKKKVADVPGGDLKGDLIGIERDPTDGTLDSRAKCYRALREPDLHVFAKLFEDCLKRSFEAQAFSWREIGGDDDVLDFLVGHFVDVDLTRQPAS